MLRRAVVPNIMDLTQNQWTKVLGQNPARSWGKVTDHTLTGAQNQVYIGENPWMVDFGTTTDLVISAILSGPNTWASATKGFIELDFIVDVLSGNQTLISFGDTSANEKLDVYVDGSGNVHADLVVATADQWKCDTDNAITAGQLYRLRLVHDGVAPEIWIDGEPWNITFTDSTDKTKFMADLTLVDNAYIGSLNFNGAGIAQRLDGKIGYCRIVNWTGGAGSHDQCARYLFDDGTGETEITDTSSFGDHGTLTVGNGSWDWDAKTQGENLIVDYEMSNNGKVNFQLKKPWWVYTTATGQKVSVRETEYAK